MSCQPVPDLGFEPSLDEVLDDPMVQAVMARDGVGRADLEDLVRTVQITLDAANENCADSGCFGPRR